jgi:hypothetical protein
MTESHTLRAGVFLPPFHHSIFRFPVAEIVIEGQ